MTATSREIANEALQSRAPAHAAKELMRRVDHKLLVGIDQNIRRPSRDIQPGVTLSAASVRFLAPDAATRARIEQIATSVAEKHNTRVGSSRYEDDFYVIFGPQPSSFLNLPATYKMASSRDDNEFSEAEEDAAVEDANAFDAAMLLSGSEPASHGIEGGRGRGVLFDPLLARQSMADHSARALVDFWVSLHPEATKVRVAWVSLDPGVTGAVMELGQVTPTAAMLSTLTQAGQEHGVETAYVMNGSECALVAGPAPVRDLVQSLVGKRDGAIVVMDYDPDTNEYEVVEPERRRHSDDVSDMEANGIGDDMELNAADLTAADRAGIQNSALALVDLWMTHNPDADNVWVVQLVTDDGDVGAMIDGGRGTAPASVLSALGSSAREHNVRGTTSSNGSNYGLITSPSDAVAVLKNIINGRGYVQLVSYDPIEEGYEVLSPWKRAYNVQERQVHTPPAVGSIFQKIGESFRRKPDGIKRQIANLEAQIAKLKTKLKTMEPDAETEAGVDAATAGILDMAYAGDLDAASGALDDLHDALGMECESNDEFESGGARRGGGVRRKPKVRRKIVRAKRQKQRTRAIRSLGQSIRQANASASASSAPASQDGGGGGGSDSGGGSGSDGGGGYDGGGYDGGEGSSPTTIVFADGGDDDGEEYEEEEIIELEGLDDDDDDDDDLAEEDDDLDDIEDDELDAILADLLDPDGDDVDGDGDDVETGNVRDFLGMADAGGDDDYPEGNPYHGFDTIEQPCLDDKYHLKIDQILAGLDGEDEDEDDIEDDDADDDFDGEDDEDDDTEDLLAGMLDDDDFGEFDDETEDDGTCEDCQNS